MSETPRDCKHGQLAQSCELCELERENATLREQLAERENWDRLRGEEARRLTNEIAEARRTRDVVLSANVNITMERNQIREQLAERDAEIAALKGHAEAMADELARQYGSYENKLSEALPAYRAAYPKE